ncbi:hypothetical protein [Oceanobacillus timonensis]|uniref:hypothetical protein n=1 Tax=Oceanobacillus timonensis TaxID=1926285 RepID=UPI0009BABB4B|nr:hypothetical protein [Oceanobacillus timonensis]
MIIVFVIIILLILFVNKRFTNRDSKPKFSAQIGMAAVVIATTMLTLFNDNAGNQAFKYIAVGIGIMSAVAILYEAFITKTET